MKTIINAAMTIDGKIDTFERKGASISSAEDKRRVLELRASVDAVMVGGHTLIKESPKLTVKLPELVEKRLSEGKTPNPAKIGIVTVAELDAHGDFITAGPARKIIFTTTQTSQDQVNVLQKLGVEVFVLGEKRVDLEKAFQVLPTLGIHSVMLEGGATLIAEVIRLGLADELQVYIAPKIFGGKTAPTLVGGSGAVESAAKRLELVNVQVMDEGGGVLIRYRLIKK
jgi:2,5-diamino-6-(ribosylamino)-4(3H)-pyrimidinone 5'-phosphate reductase